MSDEERVQAGSRKAVREAGRKEKRDETRFENDLREILDLPAGQRFLAWLLFEECCVLDSSYHTSGQTFAFNEGHRDVGVHVQGELIKASPEGWLALLRAHYVKPPV